MHRPFFSYFSHILSLMSCLVFYAFPVKGMTNDNIDKHVNNKTVNNVNMSEIASPTPYQSSILSTKKNIVDEYESDDDHNFESVYTIESGTLSNQQEGIPSIAHEYEAIYSRFINGKLIFQSNQEKHMTVNTPKEFPLSQFAYTLNGEFDLSGLTITFQNRTLNIRDYLRIKVGFRTEKENESKITAWILPRFIVDQSNSSFKSISWISDIGIFWSWGEHYLSLFDYLTFQNFDEISSKNLHDLWRSIPTEQSAGIRDALLLWNFVNEIATLSAFSLKS